MLIYMSVIVVIYCTPRGIIIFYMEIDSMYMYV